jgi:hypothetical protein
MRRSFRIAFVLSLSCCTLLPVAGWAVAVGQEPAKVENQAKPEAAKPAPEAPSASKPSLSKPMSELRDRVRQTLGLCYRLPVNTRDSTPAEIMDFCAGFGCYAEITDAATGKKINGVGALCWNYSCAGYQLFMPNTNAPVARVGYGLQRQPGEMLAFLAMAMVNPDYEMRAGTFRGTVADLVAQEKLTCRSGSNLSLKLLGLSYYVADDGTWKDQAGQEWSIERLIGEELDRKPDVSSPDVTNRLLGLSFALHRRAKRGLPIEGVYQRAQDHVSQYQPYALDLQNADGSWNSEFFALKGPSSDFTGTVRSTGRILEWLAFSLPEDRLQEAKVVRSVNYLADLLGKQAPSWNLASLTPRDIEAVMHAVHALSIYDQRVFSPFDAQTPAGDAKKSAQVLPARPNRYAVKPAPATSMR